jgi:hypothetical protein
VALAALAQEVALAVLVQEAAALVVAEGTEGIIQLLVFVSALIFN